MNLLFVVCICSLLSTAITAELRPCKPEDYHFEYTSCDKSGMRWRVAVPDHNVCTPAADSYHSVPVNGTNCRTECGSGQYLSLESQTCVKCKAGTYSSGSITKFDDWTKLPQGFSVTTESFQSYGDDMNPINCTKNEWTPKGSYITMTPGVCAGNLILSVSLVKAGNLKFEYQYPNSDSLFHVTVQNDQCQAYGDKDSSVWPEVTEGGKWQEQRISLKSGFNVLIWRVVGLRSGSDLQPILLRKVEVSGLAYSSNCASCAAGSFSSDGASECTLCPMNTFAADKGASFCTPCDAKTQYAVGGATKCQTRPACTEQDYYHLYEPCNEKDQTRAVYQWIQPIICNIDLPNSVKLPTSSDFIPCHTCNPGMHLVNETCMFCPKDTISDGTKCKSCEPSTAPDYGLWYQNWNSIPEGLSQACISFTEDKCTNDTQWLPYGDHLASHFSRGQSAYLVLQVQVPGFRTAQRVGDGSSLTVGQVSIIFETTCESFCQMVLLSDEGGNQDIIASWENTQPKTTYLHNVKKNGTYTYTVAFQNGGWVFDFTDFKNNSAKLYAIEVTNTISGGAQECQKCPKGIDQDGCIPCPDGHYIDTSTVSCVKCPPGTVVYSHKSYGVDSCKTCGPGLQVYQGRVCMSNGLFTSDTGKNFDLREQTGNQFVQGSLLFTTTGTQYYHGFNISLFGDPDKSQVTCANNVSSTSNSAMREPHSIMAKICRSTLVPAQGNSSDVMATQATSLGDHLTAIIHNETSVASQNGSSLSIKALYNTSGFDIEDIENDIQVHFSAEMPTKACPTGRKTVISLRCDADAKDGGEILVPPKCSDGTCDGCTFHFMWRLQNACPICSKEDFTEVIGECYQGSQIIHYLQPQHCLIKEKMEQKTQTCTVQLTALPFFIQIMIPVFIGVGVIMFCLICFFWRKNKKLEYSYMKLKENHGGNDEELPGVESCAVEEGDLDDQGDSVEIKDSKGARFFKKLTNKIKGDDAFESTLMNERMPLT